MRSTSAAYSGAVGVSSIIIVQTDIRDIEYFISKWELVSVEWVLFEKCAFSELPIFTENTFFEKATLFRKPPF